MGLVSVLLLAIGLRGLALLLVMLLCFIPMMAGVFIVATRVLPPSLYPSGLAVLSLNTDKSVKDD
jgi:hypothetical protein